MKQKIITSALLLIGAMPLALPAAAEQGSAAHESATTGEAATSSAAKGKSAGEYIDDATITAKVKAKFIEDKAVKATDIKVKTYKGSVQLSGFADNPEEVDRAVQLAGDVAGVKSVRNDIRLK